MTDTSRQAFEEWWNPKKLPEQAPDRLHHLYAEKAWLASEQRILALLESEEMVETIAESMCIKATMCERVSYGDLAKSAIAAIIEKVRSNA